jgi:hypothetical protein
LQQPSSAAPRKGRAQTLRNDVIHAWRILGGIADEVAMRRQAQAETAHGDVTSYWLRVFRLMGFACKVLGLLILGAIA